MDFLKKVLVIILTPYQSWIKFQEQKQIEKNAEIHSMQLNMAIDELTYFFNADNASDNNDRIIRVVEQINKLSRLLEQAYPHCSRRMQRRLHFTLRENKSFLQLYQSI